MEWGGGGGRKGHYPGGRPVWVFWARYTSGVPDVLGLVPLGSGKSLSVGGPVPTQNPLVLTQARFWFRGQMCGNTGLPPKTVLPRSIMCCEHYAVGQTYVYRHNIAVRPEP